MKWQTYLPSPETQSLAPFLILRAVNVDDRGAHRPFHINALLDTGSSISSIPKVVVAESERAGIILTKGATKTVYEGQDVRPGVPAYRFYVTICVAPKLIEEFNGSQELEEYFNRTRPLYQNRPPYYTLETHRGRSRLGLEMATTDRPYALIGRDIISQWTVLLHGPTGRFRVLLGRLCNWLVCSPGPRLARS